MSLLTPDRPIHPAINTTSPAGATTTTSTAGASASTRRIDRGSIDLTHSEKRFGTRRLTASVCLPARNEESTIGPLVRALRETLLRDRVADEVVVIDDRSSDFTANEAEMAGAVVHHSSSILPEFGPSLGKGDALWRSVAATTSDLILWCDADLESVDFNRLGELLEVLRTDPHAMLVKGYFDRLDEHGQRTTGGRVTELAARPLLALVAPQLGHIREPLSGMMAIRRSTAELLPFDADYGVDVGLLLDTNRLFGPRSIRQIGLGPLRHRNQPIESLAVQSGCVQRAILTRAGHHRSQLGGALHRPDRDSATLTTAQRPPLRSLLRKVN